MQLIYKFRIGKRELTQSDIERIICEYAEQQGIIAYEMNFHDFKEVGINTLKKANVIAKFASAVIFIPSDVIANYLHTKKIQISVGITGFGTWTVSSGNGVTASGKTIESALTNFVIKIERALNDNRATLTV